MKPQYEGRFCKSCSKVVVDFTNKSEQEIIEYLNKNAEKKLCGTFRKSHLVSQQQNHIERQKAEQILKFVAAVLLVFGTTLISCNYEVSTKSIDLGDTLKVNDTFCENTTGVLVVGKIETDQTNMSNGVGIKVVDDTVSENYVEEHLKSTPLSLKGAKDSLVEADEIVTFPDKNAQFLNGEKSIKDFIKENIEYPKDTEVKGTVYVSFVIKRDGSMNNVKLLKGISPQLDEEALRVVKLMLKWIPGKKDGKDVNTRMVLPIKFK